MSLFVKFWGARGSIPTPGSGTKVYGGNTSCVEIRIDDAVFICDAGSGIRECGNDLMTRKPYPENFHLFITHAHWDHIQGFPFFSPAYRKESKIHVYAPKKGEVNICRLLSGQMSASYFPISFSDLQAKIIADDLDNGLKIISGVTVKSFPLNHPGGCYGYSFDKAGKKIVYATDNEFMLDAADTFPDTDHQGPLRKMPADMLKACNKADLLIMDAQYDDTSYVNKEGWGHSSCLSVVDFAIQANVKSLALFHHDPEDGDSVIDEKVKSCQERAAHFNSDIMIFAARESLELKV